MDLAIIDQTKDGVSQYHQDLVRTVLDYAGRYLKQH